MLNKNYFIRYIYLSIFSIALAYLEAAAVIYIRQLLYLQGFQFPITSSLSSFILHIEILREFSTLIIIFSVALLAGKKFIDRFAYLIYIFAVWDIFYYVFLKLTIKWPLTFLTWDVLFLIPIPWTSPILFPLLCSVTLLAISIFLYYYFNKYNLHTLSKLEWSLLAVGAFIIFISFIFNYLKIIFENFNLILKGISLSLLVLNYIPQRFYWEIFTVGELIAISSLFVISRRVKKIEVMKKDWLSKEKGQSPGNSIPDETIDISKNLETFVMIFDKDKNLVATSAMMSSVKSVYPKFELIKPFDALVNLDYYSKWLPQGVKFRTKFWMN